MLIRFEIYNDGEFWCARGIGVDIFTQGRTPDELKENIREAVGVYCDDSIDAGEQIKIVSLTKIPGWFRCQNLRLLTDTIS